MGKYEDTNESHDGGSVKPEKKKRVGGYILGRTLGEGSFAKVRLGTHVISNEKVAVKVINKKLIAKREYVRKNMRREAVMLQRLDHPNIIRLYEVMETENSFYMVTDLAEGGDFMKYLTDRECLSEQETRRYMRQIVSSVDHMHRSGVIHRDLKIENLLLDADMNIKIIDYGLSNHWDGDNLLATQCGSPAYAAPEIFSKKKYGTAVDIWSIGINMFAMLTGRLPFLVDPPTNLTKLHALILQGCTVPDYLSPDCKDLLKRLLDPMEDNRITMSQLMQHTWLNDGYEQLEHWDLRSPMTPQEIDSSVVKYMVNTLGLIERDIRESILHSKPNSMTGTYMLLCDRLDRNLSFPDDASMTQGHRRDVITEMKRHASSTQSVNKCGTSISENRGLMNGHVEHVNGKFPNLRDEIPGTARSGSSRMKRTESIRSTQSERPVSRRSGGRDSSAFQSAYMQVRGHRISKKENTRHSIDSALNQIHQNIEAMRNTRGERDVVTDTESLSRESHHSAASYQSGNLRSIPGRRRPTTKGILKREKASSVPSSLDIVPEPPQTRPLALLGRNESPTNVPRTANSPNQRNMRWPVGYKSKHQEMSIGNDRSDKASMSPTDIDNLSDKLMSEKLETSRSQRSALGPARNNIHYSSRRSRGTRDNEEANLALESTPNSHERTIPPELVRRAPGSYTTGSQSSNIGRSRSLKQYHNHPPPPTISHAHSNNSINGYEKTTPRPPSVRRTTSDRVDADDDRFYDKYRFKVRNTDGDRTLLLDLKDMHLTSDKTGNVNRSNTMPDLKPRRMGPLTTGDRQRDLSPGKEAVPLSSIGAYYTVPEYEGLSARTGATDTGSAHIADMQSHLTPNSVKWGSGRSITTPRESPRTQRTSREVYREYLTQRHNTSSYKAPQLTTVLHTAHK